MFSKLLIKLIDQAIIPALVMLSTRVVSIILVSNYYDIPFTVNESGFSFGTLENYVLVNSLSLLAMQGVIVLGVILVLIKAYFFHESHITPSMTARLFSLRLSSFIQASFDVYSQGAIWMSYAYLLMLVMGLMGLFGLVYWWVFIASVLLVVMGTVFLVLDIEEELGMKRIKPRFDNDLIYVEEMEVKING